MKNIISENRPVHVPGRKPGYKPNEADLFVSQIYDLLNSFRRMSRKKKGEFFDQMRMAEYYVRSKPVGAIVAEVVEVINSEYYGDPQRSDKTTKLKRNLPKNVVALPTRTKTTTAPILPADKNNVIPFPAKNTFSVRLNDDAMLGLGDLKRGAVLKFQTVFNESGITPETLCCVYVKKYGGLHCGFLTINKNSVKLTTPNPAYETLYFSLSEIEIKGVAVDRTLHRKLSSSGRN